MAAVACHDMTGAANNRALQYLMILWIRNNASESVGDLNHTREEKNLVDSLNNIVLWHIALQTEYRLQLRQNLL